METKINIAEILKNKPQGIKLYSPIFGDCTFCYIQDETSDICVRRPYNEMSYFNFEGLYNAAGECLLFPSRFMRDWSKFTWKKGDVLQKNSHTQVIFDSFVSDTYEVIRCKYFLNVDNGNETCIEETNVFTKDYFKANEEQKQCYINKIEEILGGKLNYETLKIEKVQPKFKDGDILYAEGDGSHIAGIFILKIVGGLRKCYACLFLGSYMVCHYDGIGFIGNETLRYATEEEKQQLSDALTKEGKYWDAEKKQIVDIKPEIKLQPFDKVLVRDQDCDSWQISLFGYKNRYYYRCSNGYSWNQCIPYKGNEHLLGTTNSPE